MYQLAAPIRAHMSFAHSTSWTRKHIAFHVYRLIVFDFFVSPIAQQTLYRINIEYYWFTCSCFFISVRSANPNPHIAA